MNADKIRQYAADPEAFANDVPIDTRDGVRLFGAVMDPEQRALVRGLAPSVRAVSCGQVPPVSRFWCEMTKGYAKTLTIAIMVLWMTAFTRRMLRIQVAARDKDQAAEVRWAASRILKEMPWLALRVRVDNWQLKCDETGATCEILPDDRDGSHGAGPDALFIDELTHIERETRVLNLQDNAEKIAHSLVMLSMNAGLVDSWQYRQRERARQSSRWAFFQAAQPPPHITQEALDDALSRSTRERFDRLWNGIWSRGGDALDADDVEAAFTLPGPLASVDCLLDDVVWAAGLDIGHKHDATGFAIVGKSRTSGRFQLGHIASWLPRKGGEVDLEIVREHVAEYARRFRVRTCAFDPSQAALMATELRRRGVDMTEVPFSGKNCDDMANTVLQAFRGRTIDLFHDAQLKRDILRLVIIERSYGYKLEATRDAQGHADKATALMLGMLAARDIKSSRGVLVADEPEVQQRELNSDDDDESCSRWAGSWGFGGKRF